MGDTGTGTQGGAQKVRPSIWPEPEPPMICTGQGARNAPPPLWLAPAHVRTGASRLPPDSAQEWVYAWHAAPSPICEKGTGMGRHASYVAPPPCTPHLSPLCLPSPLCVQRSMQMGEVQRGGACKGRLRAPSPSCCVAPTYAHPRWCTLSPFHAQGSCHPPLCTNGECRAVRKGASHSPFRPSPPLSRIEQGERRTPTPLQGTETRARRTTPAVTVLMGRSLTQRL
jgi:hypothetical protein